MNDLRVRNQQDQTMTNTEIAVVVTVATDFVLFAAVLFLKWMVAYMDRRNINELLDIWRKEKGKEKAE